MQPEVFDYQNRMGSRLISYLTLVLTLCISLAARLQLGSGSLATVFVFLCSLLGLSLIGVFVNRALFIHEGTYTLTPERLVLDAGKQHIELIPDEVNGVGCDPVYEKGSKGTDTVKCWRLSLMTVKGNYEFYSPNVLEHDENNRVSIHQFKTLGRELKRWVGML